MAYAKEIMGGGLSAGQAQAIGGQYNGIVALGSAQSDAAPLTSSLSVVTAADGTKGVILPAGQVGDAVTIFNNSASTLKVYPPSGAAIAVVGTGVGSANSAHSALTYKTVTYICFSSTQWVPMIST